MSVYLQTLGYKVHLAITKESFLSDSKHIGAYAQALEAIRSTLSKEYLMHVSNIDSAFAAWNILTTTTTSKLQLQIQLEDESSGDESEPQQYYTVQGNYSLEVYSDTQLDSASSSFDSHDDMDAYALNEELSIVCENLLEKYKVLKKKTFALNKENENLSSKLKLILQEKKEIASERCRLSKNH